LKQHLQIGTHASDDGTTPIVVTNANVEIKLVGTLADAGVTSYRRTIRYICTITGG